MVPIMVSYFNHSNFYGGSEPGPHQNLYANLHVYALILFITATVLNQITCLFAPVLLFLTLSFLISAVELWCTGCPNSSLYVLNSLCDLDFEF